MKRTVLIHCDHHAFKTVIDDNVVTVHPDCPLAARNGFITDDRVPEGYAVRGGRRLSVMNLQELQSFLDQKCPDVTLERALMTDDWRPEKPIPAPRMTSTILVVQFGPIGSRPPAWHIFPQGRYQSRTEIKVFATKVWPSDLLYLELPDRGVAEYAAAKLEKDRFPGLSGECLVRCH